MLDKVIIKTMKKSNNLLPDKVYQKCIACTHVPFQLKVHMPCLAGRGITQWVGELAVKAGGLEAGSPEPT